MSAKKSKLPDLHYDLRKAIVRLLNEFERASECGVRVIGNIERSNESSKIEDIQILISP